MNSAYSQLFNGGLPINAALPLQQVKLSEKMKDKDKFGVSDWMKNSMDALESIGRYQFYQNLALRDNYRIILGRFDIKDYIDSNDYYDITSAIAEQLQLPSYLKHYDITTKAVNLLLGEFLKRPDLFKVRAVDDYSKNERVRIKTELLQEYMMGQVRNEITSKLISQGIDPFRNDFKTGEEAAEYKQAIEQKYQEMTPESIERYMRYDYRNAAESWGQAVLNVDKERFYLKEQEKREFTHMLVADRCFTHFRLTPTGYELEDWNPVEVFFSQAPNVYHLEDGDYIGRVYYMSKARVIERYGWKMTREQQESLYLNYVSGGSGGSTGFGQYLQAVMTPFPGFTEYAGITSALGFNPAANPLGNVPLLQAFGDDPLFNLGYTFNSMDMVQVTEGYWRSQRRIGKLMLLNPETQEIDIQLVDETFDPKLFGIKEVKTSFDNEEELEPNTIVWAWQGQIWGGTKINVNYSQNPGTNDRNALYIDVKPCDFQFKGDYNPYNPKLPVVGQVFNNMNGRSMGLVDLLKPYQIFVNALYNQAYGIVQRNNGKLFLLDSQLLPHNKDWGGEEALEKFRTIAQSLGMAVIDTSPQNMAGGTVFNQIAVHDLDESDKVVKLINIAMMIENQGYLQLGITPQRQGQTQASETATGVQQSINNSYAITETYFENYYLYKKRKLKMLLDIAQFVSAKKDDITLSYITSDLGEAYIKVTGTELLLSDLGVFLDYSQDYVRQRAQVEQLLANNTTGLPMSGLIEIVKLSSSASLSDIQKKIEELEAKQQQDIQAQREHEANMQKQALDAKAKEIADQRAWQSQENQLDRENRLQDSAIKSANFDPDVANSGSVEVFDQAKLAIEQSKIAADSSYKNLDLLTRQLNENKKHKLEETKLKLQQKEQKIKEKQAKDKQNAEKLKNKGIELQNKSQEKMQKVEMKMLDKKAKNDEILGKIKIQTAKIAAKKKKTTK